MAKLIWTEPALADLNERAEYIALENPAASSFLVQQVFFVVERLEQQPTSGKNPAELDGRRYRQVVSGPCLIFYRHSQEHVLVIYIMRSERQLRNFLLGDRNDRGS